MKYLNLIFFCFLIFSCSSSKTVYWCGDHPCINKKEKKTYFEKNMIVEKRGLNKNDKLSKSEKDLILKKIREEEKRNYKNKKKQKKQARNIKKKKIKEEKELAKLDDADERIISGNKKDCSNPTGFHQKMMCAAKKKNKDNSAKTYSKNKKKKLDTDLNIAKIDESISEFNDYVERITKKNMLKPYPDINDIPK